MKILITGVRGFIGKVVLDETIKQYGADNIVALSSETIKGVKTLIYNDYLWDNLLEEDSCEDVDTIIHIGAFTPKNHHLANDIEKCTLNIISTKNLLKMKMPCLKKIIYISTLDVYANNIIISENTATLPYTLYGHSKLYCEKIVEAFAKEKGIVCQILRVGHVFGPGEDAYQKIIPVTITKVLNNEQLTIYGDGEAIRTFIYVDDVAKIILKALTLSSYNGPINIVGDEQITINQIIDCVKRKSGIAANVVYVPSDNPNINYIFDNAKLKTIYPDKLTTFCDGILKEIRYMESI